MYISFPRRLLMSASQQLDIDGKLWVMPVLLELFAFPFAWISVQMLHDHEQWKDITKYALTGIFLSIAGVAWAVFRKRIAKLSPWSQLRIVRAELAQALEENLHRKERSAYMEEVESQSKPSKLNIIKAEYRAFAEGGQKIDVTPVLKLMVAEDALVFRVKTASFKAGGLDPVTEDPFEGQIKRVEVTYSYRNGSPITTEAMEDDLLVLPEDILLVPLQRHAIRFSIKLLQFLQQLGPSPMPKYTEEQIRNMPDRERLKPEVFNDPDYIDACEFHYPSGHEFIGSLRIWHEKVAAGYNLHHFSDLTPKFVRFGV
jgi:hypothetical protein